MDEDGDEDEDDDDDDDDPPLVGRMLCKYILRSNHQPTGGWNTAPMVSANTSFNWNSGAQKVSNLNHVSWCFLRIFGSGWSDGTLARGTLQLRSSKTSQKLAATSPGTQTPQDAGENDGIGQIFAMSLRQQAQSLRPLSWKC